MTSQEEISKRVKLLEKIITERRTIRKFTAEYPAREEIEKVIEAGILAPFSIIGTERDEDFRKFHVFKIGTEARDTISRLLKKDAEETGRLSQTRRSQESTTTIGGVEYTHNIPARTSEQAHDLLYQYYMQKGHLDDLEKAPFLIVMTEKRRGPLLSSHADRQSMAHCMQNMWLMASELGLGFQPVSALAYLARETEFCQLIGCMTGEFEIDGFLLGYPAEFPGPNPKQFQPEKIITWYE